MRPTFVCTKKRAPMIWPTAFAGELEQVNHAKPQRGLPLQTCTRYLSAARPVKVSRVAERVAQLKPCRLHWAGVSQPGTVFLRHGGDDFAISIFARIS